MVEIDASECFFFLFGEGCLTILFPLIGGMSRIKMEFGGRFERGVTTFKSLASAFSHVFARTRMLPVDVVDVGKVTFFLDKKSAWQYCFP